MALRHITESWLACFEKMDTTTRAARFKPGYNYYRNIKARLLQAASLSEVCEDFELDVTCDLNLSTR